MRFVLDSRRIYAQLPKYIDVVQTTYLLPQVGKNEDIGANIIDGSEGESGKKGIIMMIMAMSAMKGMLYGLLRCLGCA